MTDTPIVLLVARALHFWAVATLFGGAGLLLLLRQPSRHADGLLRGAGLIAALSGLAWFAWVFANVASDAGAILDRAAWQAFLSAPFALPWMLRLGLCAVALIAVMRPALWPCLLMGLGFAIDQAWLGHAAGAVGASVGPQFASYWLHVMAGFAWTGALIMICVLSFEAKRIPQSGLTLFSTIGVVIVAVILASGLVNAWYRGVRLTALFTTPYGELLGIKIGLFTIMVGLALVNRRRARLDEAQAPSASLWFEMAFGLVVLLAAAALGVTPPPGDG